MKGEYRKVKIPYYLINIKYPVIDRYDCYECPGAYYLNWKPLKLFKLFEKEKTVYVSPHQLLIEQMYRITEKAYQSMVERYIVDDNSFYGS